MTRFVALSGFLGAGKTTTLIAAAELMERTGQRVAVVTNDQGTDLIDSTLARRNTSLAAEVTGGCFCCRFDDLMSVTRDLIESSAPDVIIAEAVGSCTDLQATVVRPLTAYYGGQFSVAPLTTVVDPLRLLAFRSAESGEPESDLSYLFGKQLAEAEIIALNKIDLVGEADATATFTSLGQAHPAARIVPYSARTGTGLTELLQAWQASTAWEGSLEIDYDRYAAAEAQLAWLNQRFDVRTSGTTGFDPVRWAEAAVRKTAELTGVPDADIGHIKLTLDTDAGMFKASITGTTSGPVIDLLPDGVAQRGTAVINARVACEPAILDSAALAAISYADQITGTSSQAHAAASFKPGYPKPVHRLTGPATSGAAPSK
jgi:Ni2+-binding GTPase involved in maturation of urease and hydrogenase